MLIASLLPNAVFIMMMQNNEEMTILASLIYLLCTIHLRRIRILCKKNCSSNAIHYLLRKFFKPFSLRYLVDTNEKTCQINIIKLFLIAYLLKVMNSCPGREPWSSVYGRRLMFRRLWVHIPALYT